MIPCADTDNSVHVGTFVDATGEDIDIHAWPDWSFVSLGEELIGDAQLDGVIEMLAQARTHLPSIKNPGAHYDTLLNLINRTLHQSLSCQTMPTEGLAVIRIAPGYEPGLGVGEELAAQLQQNGNDELLAIGVMALACLMERQRAQITLPLPIGGGKPS